MHRLTAYGHSWVHGSGATGSERALVNMTARGLDCAADNRGVGGTLGPQTAERVSAQQPPDSMMFLLMTGLNDARLHGPCVGALDRYSAALHSIVRVLQAASPEALIVAVEQPHLLDYSLHPPHDRGSNDDVNAYNVRLRQVVGSYRGVLLVTVGRWDPRTMLAEDTVHPNDAGHAEVARAVVQSVQSRPSSRSSAAAALQDWSRLPSASPLIGS